MPTTTPKSQKPSTKKSKTSKQKILIASSESVPFIKTGGLADACGALAKSLSQKGHEVRLVLPRYWGVDKDVWKLKPRISPMGVAMGNATVWCEVLEGKWQGVTVYFIEHEGYFGRRGIYDDGKHEYLDNAERFGFFSRAVLQLCRDLNFQPDIIHSHDWQAALTAPYLKLLSLKDPFFEKTASVFSIHNIGYQGKFASESLEFLGLGGEAFQPDRFEDSGMINFMKGAVFYADAINTVSPTYAREILSEPGGSGISTYLERRRDDVCGILNGADYDDWDPACDAFIPARYSPSKMKGKKTCKDQLQNLFMLERRADLPVFAVISRFAVQKGLSLLAEVIEEALRSMEVQFVILGSGEKHLEDFFGGLPARYPGRVGAWIGYDNARAHWIEAGADFFVMPSLYEPCGLNQIYSLRYGTLPIVRETGGLADTIEQYDEKTGEGTGFRFKAADARALYDTLGWAVSTWYDRPKHIQKMRRKAMKQQFLWQDSVTEYEKLYARAHERRGSWG